MSLERLLPELFCAYLLEPSGGRRLRLAERIRSYLQRAPARAPCPILEAHRRKPIERGASTAGWKDLPCRSLAEELRAIGPYSPSPAIMSSASYFKEDFAMEGLLERALDRDRALLSPFLRRSVADRLDSVSAKLAREGLLLIVFDAFRPRGVQEALFEIFKRRLRGEDPAASEDSLDLRAQKYVSKPAPDASAGLTHVSPHISGGAVNLTIGRLSAEGLALSELLAGADLGASRFNGIKRLIEKELERGPVLTHDPAGLLREYLVSSARRAFCRPLDMGCPFDYFGPQAASLYFEAAEQGEVVANRRLLYNLMLEAGFENYEEEWWHYSVGDGMAAAKKGQAESCYHEASLSPQHREFEDLRRRLWFILPTAAIGECIE